MKLRHPDLDQTIDVPDDEGCIAVHRESGWEPVPEPTQTNPALAPGEIEAKPAKSRKTADGHSSSTTA